MSAIGVAISIPFKRTLVSIPSSVKDSLVFWLDRIVEDAEYPNKAGNQDRVAAGGVVFPGRALAFDSADQCAYVVDNGDLDIVEASTDFILSGWAKPTASANTEYLFGKLVNTSLSGRYGFYKGTDNRVFLHFETSTGTYSLATGIDIDTDTDWHLYTVRFDLSGSRYYLYTDGVIVNAGGTAFTGSFLSLNDSYKFYIGCGNDNSPIGDPVTFADTQLRDIRVYNKDVTSAANLASLQKGERLGDEVAWYFCEGTDLLEVFDASGNGYHMTAENFDSTSFVEGNWYSLMNKYGYAINALENLNSRLIWTAGSDAAAISGSGLGIGNGIYLLNDAVAFGSWELDRDLYIGEKFQIDYTIANLTQAGIFARLSVHADNQGANRTANGTYQDIIEKITGNPTWESRVDFRGTAECASGTAINDITISKLYESAIPPDMSTTVNGVPTHDIVGNELTFAGQAQYPAIARDRSCGISDGVAGWEAAEDDLLTDIDLSLRVLITEQTTTKYICSKYQNSNYNYYFRIDIDGAIRFRSEVNTVAVSAISNETLSVDTWYTLRIVSNTGNAMQLFIDGTEVTYDTQHTAQSLDINGPIKVWSLGASNYVEGVNIENFILNNGPNWQFVEGQGNTVHDVSGNGNHLTGSSVDNNNWGVIDTPTEDYLAEYGGNFVGNFNGTDDGIDLDSPIVIDYTADTDIEFRARRLTTATTDPILGLTTSDSRSWVQFNSNDALLIESDSNGDIARSNNSIIDDDDWHDYVVTVNNGVVSMTQDGSPLTMALSALTDDLTFDKIGASAALHIFPGGIAYVRIKNNTTGAYMLDVQVTGIEFEDTFGTWEGTGIHSSIIPALSDKSADAVGQVLVYPQRGKNLVPYTYLSMPENVYELYAADQEERYEELSPSDYDDWTIAANLAGAEWSSDGSNTRAEVNGQMETTIVDAPAGGRRYFAATEQIGTDLVVGDSYRLVVEARVLNTDADAVIRVFNGVGYETGQSLTTTLQIFTLDFVASSATLAFMNFNTVDIGNKIYLRDMVLFHKTVQTGNNLIENSGARNAIGALTTTDWSKTTGLLDIDVFSDHASVIDGATKVETSEDLLSMIPQGSELFPNVDFANWTGDDPDDCSISAEDVNNYVTEHANGAQFVFDNDNPTGLSMRCAIPMTVGKYYVVEIITSGYGSTGDCEIRNSSSSNTLGTIGSDGTTKYVFRAIGSDILVVRNSGADFDIIFEQISVKELQVVSDDLVTNGTLTANADMNVSNCVNLSYDDGVGGGFSNGTPTGFDVVSDGTSFQGCGTADEITYVNGQKYIITFDLVRNSGAMPSFTLRDSLGGSTIHDGGYLSPNEGSNVHEVEVTSTTTGVVFFHNSSQVTDYQITNLSVSDAVTDWENGVGVIVANGVANWDGSQTSGIDGFLKQDNILLAGTANIVRFTVTRSAGEIRPRLNSEYGNFVSSSGTYEYMVFAEVGNRDLQFYADADFIGTVDDVSVHQLTWGRQITDDSTNYAGFQYALPVDEFDFAIPVDYVAESIVAQQFSNGLADDLSDPSIANQIFALVTGNGFSGKAQRVVQDGLGIIRFPSYTSRYHIQNEYVRIRMKYRTNRSDISWQNGISGTNLAVATGDAAIYEETLQMTSSSGNRAFRLLSAATATIGDYLEVDEFEIRHIIDGEFYELEDLGGDPVIVNTNYFAENPSRYLTRYFNAVDWRDLLLLEADHSLDYSDHITLMKFTKNS